MSDFRRVTVLDTATASTNLGDQIIMDAVRRELAGIFPDALMLSVASHEWMGAKSRGLVRNAELAIASGTNLLSSRMWFRSPWKVGFRDALSINSVVLMGCGWYQYQRAVDPYSRWLLRRVLSRNHIHAVRDSYSLANLAKIGITNVVNTSCPTLWQFTPALCQALPREKARDVVTTVNTYIKDREADAKLLQLLRARYETVYLWVQTNEDWAYASDLVPGLTRLVPSLAAFDALLDDHPSLDYVGNRLHGGIRALQKGRRAVIIEVDNRAAEMGADFNLPTVGRTDFEKLDHLIQNPFDIHVKPPMERIEAWKSQFAT